MRSALWETSVGALAALLNSGAPLNKADLWTITLQGGAVLRWSGADFALTGNSQTWELGPGIKRGRVRFQVGVAVSQLNMTWTDILGTFVNGVPLMSFIQAGGLNNARVQLDRAFWGASDTAPVGALLWFPGRIADIPRVDRYSADIVVKSDTELLDVMVPRDVYQPGCLNTLFDAACGLARSGYTVTGAATSASTADRTTFNHALAQAVGYFDLGVVRMTSGANNGISRTVKRYLAGTLSVMPPWPLAVGNGDTFSIYPGCDKTQATCTSKFSNLARFRGQPYIPAPETVL